ncbi:SOS response-associated peptidase [Acidithiobacillus sp.]|uniref:SOS response-associated peptidase n=1 Tax=Acidithiobacillus sp. TaxID=1872118 RepID=UPI0025C532C0|nr:SOS response-associated peptidase [Acidithiobacillus sp.]
MCGRFAFKSPPERLHAQFGADITDLQWTPHFNIGPQQLVPVLRTVDGQRRAALLRWGLIPSWSKAPTIGHRLINARCETAATKPAFRAALRSRRCIVPADGFFEWQQQAAGKQPFFIHRRDGALLAMAGLWEHWTSPAGENVITFTILTTAANTWMQALHDRMPVILEGEALNLWLNPTTPPSQIQALFRPLVLDTLAAYPVTPAMGNVRHDSPDILDPWPVVSSLPT